MSLYNSNFTVVMLCASDLALQHCSHTSDWGVCEPHSITLCKYTQHAPCTHTHTPQVPGQSFEVLAFSEVQYSQRLVSSFIFLKR